MAASGAFCMLLSIYILEICTSSPDLPIQYSPA